MFAQAPRGGRSLHEHRSSGCRVASRWSATSIAFGFHRSEWRQLQVSFPLPLDETTRRAEVQITRWYSASRSRPGFYSTPVGELLCAAATLKKECIGLERNSILSRPILYEFRIPGASYSATADFHFSRASSILSAPDHNEGWYVIWLYPGCRMLWRLRTGRLAFERTTSGGNLPCRCLISPRVRTER